MPKATKTISKKKTSNSNLSSRKPVKRVLAKKKTQDDEMIQSAEVLESPVAQNKKSGLNKYFVLLALLILLASLLYKNKGLVLAGMVNGKPIFRYQLEQKLVSRYGSSVLEEMINDEMIKNEGERLGIKVTTAEIDAKISEIEKSVGGKEQFDQAMSAQGITLADLKNDVSRRILVEKLVAGSVNVSDSEVADYIEKNKTTLTATDEAGLKKEALDALTSQKKSAAIQKWFTDLQSKAKVTKYL